MTLPAPRLHIVTGKGGVGKSTLTATLALAAQRQGQRVLVCEVTAKERVASLLGAPDSGPEITRIDESIWSVHIRPQEAMREYGLMVLRFKAIYSAVFENRLVRYFLRAIPSLPEVVMLGKVWFHVMEERDESGRLRWDQVILDAPATGHGLTLLRTPRTMLELVSDGPLVRDMKAMQAMLVDPAITAVHIVALPEEMPVNEAIELHQALTQQLQLPMGRLFLNGFQETRFATEELGALVASDTAELAAARLAGRQYGERQGLSALYAAKLAEQLPLPMLRLPYLAGATFGRPEVERLAVLVLDEVPRDR